MTQQPEPQYDVGWAAETYGRADAFDVRKRRDYVLFPENDQGPLRDLYRTAYFTECRRAPSERNDVSDGDRYSAECLVRGVDSLETLEAAGQRDAAHRLDRSVTNYEIEASRSELSKERLHAALAAPIPDARTPEDVAEEFEEALSNFGRPVPPEHVEMPTIGKMWLTFARDVYGELKLPEGVDDVAKLLEDLRDGKEPGVRVEAEIQRLTEITNAQQLEIAALRERLGVEERTRRDLSEKLRNLPSDVESAHQIIRAHRNSLTNHVNRIQAVEDKVKGMDVQKPSGLTFAEQVADLLRRVDAVETRIQKNADVIAQVAAAGAENDRELRRKLQKVRRRVRKLRKAERRWE